MHRATLRILLTIAMYVGVALFLLPYFSGRLSTGLLLLILGGSIAIISGLLRCYLTDGECGDRTIHKFIP